MFSLPTRPMTSQHNHCTFSSLSTVSINSTHQHFSWSFLTAEIALCHYKNTDLQLRPSQKIREELFAFKA